MPTPKFRTSKSKRNLRRSHHALKMPAQCFCANCGEVKAPHMVCTACGFYRGKQVMEPKKVDTDFTDENFDVDK